MRIMLAALLAAAPLAAHAADVPSGPGTRATLPFGFQASPLAGTIDFRGDSDWYRVRLAKGQDYAIVYSTDPTLVQEDGQTHLVVHAPDGKVLVSQDELFPQVSGAYFRAPTSGTYFVEARDEPGRTYPRGYTLAIGADCSDEPATTTCSITPGHTQARQWAGAYDPDVEAMRLVAGRAYVLELTRPGVATTPSYLAVLDRQGRQLAGGNPESGKVAFRPATTGTYYAATFPDDDRAGGPYELSLRVK